MDHTKKPLNYPSLAVNITQTKSQLFILVHITRFISKYCKIVTTKVFHNQPSSFFGTTIDYVFLYFRSSHLTVLWSILQNDLANFFKIFCYPI
uniref:Uncharacterized protein n=1 Tax=Arundo donax TaxID=35708 RepID=A0A0A8Z222_ARUDO